MSENNQSQIPINTQMSDEMGGSEIESNAIRNATIDTQTWQIYDFEKLLDLGELDRYMPIEIQHILALNAAFRSVLPALTQIPFKIFTFSQGRETQRFKPHRIVQKYISHSLRL